MANTLEEAVSRAYSGVNAIHFEGMQFRKDIAGRALKRGAAGRGLGGVESGHP